MKRSRLNQRSANRPNCENLALRNEYRFANQFCELAPLFSRRMQSGEEPLPGMASTCGRALLMTDEVNHIFGGHRGRHDVVENLICVCSDAHDWFHKFRSDGYACCFAVKLRKGEFDADVLGQIVGNRFADWFSTLEWRLVHDIGRACWSEVMKGF